MGLPLYGRPTEGAAFRRVSRRGNGRALYLLPYLEGRSHVLVVDAIDFGGRPGQVVWLREAEIPAYYGLKLSEHRSRSARYWR